MEKIDLWRNVLKQIKPLISKAHFLTWFQNTLIVELIESKVVIGVPTPFAKGWMENKYKETIIQAFNSLEVVVKDLAFDVNSNLMQKDGGGVDVRSFYDEQDSKKIRKVRGLNEVRVVKHNGAGGMEVIVSKMLNSRYTLDSYISGKENNLPHAAAMTVARDPGGIYNPLYIYGNVGLGKTHLLQGIGNSLLRSNPELVILYSTAEKFVTGLIRAIREKKTDKFKEQYRNVDVLLLDDVQFFAKKDSSQQELFHTFNDLYEQGKQIVITSDRSPSELDDLETRLRNRFENGMIVEVVAPEYETRLAILQTKCQELNILVEPAVLDFIAINVQNSVRELEGVLKQLMAQNLLSGEIPTIQSVADILRRMNRAKKIIGFDVERAVEQKFSATTSEDVIRSVAGYYNLTVHDLIGKVRVREVMIPRQVCMYLIKKELGQSYEKIGSFFGGRKHTTVMNACQQTEKKLKTDRRLLGDINSIKREMGV